MVHLLSWFTYLWEFHKSFWKMRTSEFWELSNVGEFRENFMKILKTLMRIPWIFKLLRISWESENSMGIREMFHDHERYYYLILEIVHHGRATFHEIFHDHENNIMTYFMAMKNPMKYFMTMNNLMKYFMTMKMSWNISWNISWPWTISWTISWNISWPWTMSWNI